MAGLTYRITTLGCRVNHAESREIASVMQSRGLARAAKSQPADVEVIHTCTVTHTAAAKSRHAIRRARRRVESNSRSNIASPPLVLVTGCFATTDHSVAAGLADGDDRVLEHEHRGDGDALVSRIGRRVDAWLTEAAPTRAHHHPDLNETNCQFSSGGILPLPVVPPTVGSTRHIRAELRIQDGCDAHCTFCIIPKIRRTLRSKTVPDAVREASQLVALGHKEIVLTGIFIGAYGHETALRRKQQNRHASPLAEVMDAVAQVPGLERLRISSMEPGDVDEPLLDAMVANRPVVVPHLHLPLQSGSDAVLRRMNRQYRVGEYLEMIDQVNESLTIDDLPPAITTDIIGGFPGESDDDFQQTVTVARRVGYLHMHVFPYSPRNGTAAARWTDAMVPESIRKQRVQRLINLETREPHGLAVRYCSRLLGRSVRVILEQPEADRPGWMRGRCDHYVPVFVETSRPRGSVVVAHIESVDSAGARGFIKNSDRALPLVV